MFRVLNHRSLVILVATGDIGDVITTVGNWYGHAPVRGARSGRAAAGLVEMIREMRKGRMGAFAVDGPRGPREIAKPGALYIAQKTGAAIVPITTASRRK
jgi:lysophospholipid acyltransferase (LPLAT)-like uncharacterized protein